MNEFSKTNKNGILLAVLAFLAGALVVRLFFLQIFFHPYYRRMADVNRLRLVPIPAPRGAIYDRNARRIVANRPSYSVSILPYEVHDLGLTIQRLAPIVGLTEAELEAVIKRERTTRYEPIKVKKDVDFATVARLEEQNEDLPGVIYQSEQARDYPPNNWGSHLVGYISEISEQELLQLASRGYRQGGYIGKRGIEKQYDQLLRGSDGVLYLEVTAQGKVLGEVPDKPPLRPTSGSNMVIAIDMDVQAAAESALANFCCAGAVALDPSTGEILAFVSKPVYNTAGLSVGISYDEWNGIVNDPDHPLLNRVIQSQYPPGSTAKLLTAGAALEENLISSRSHMPAACGGGYQFGNRFFRCWKPEGHGSLNLIGAIEQSCDVYFYQLGQKLGISKWAEYAKKCGFGQRTGIDLPDEARGLAPATEWYDRRFGKGKWSQGVMLNLAIGQGEFLSTPLQLASFYAALGNGGVLWKPHLLKKVQDQSGVQEYRPEIVERLPFSQETLEVLKKAMIEVVQGPHGTAHRAQLEGIVVAGKTGTAENPHGKEHSWFACFAPAENPKIAIAVLVENAGHGSDIAAPIAQQMLSAYLLKKKPTGPLVSPADSGTFEYSD
ncbi:MAG: penicillin-binding protein 2 [candidate division Zixibacteria bacterium]|nr:penicillin-binding protein 2 [candidate division Zixibacteria bacterium]